MVCGRWLVDFIVSLSLTLIGIGRDGRMSIFLSSKGMTKTKNQNKMEEVPNFLQL